MFNHIIAAKRNMALKQQEYSLTKKRSSHQMMDHKSLRSSSRTDEFIICDYDDEDETLEMNKKKKRRSMPWWDAASPVDSSSSTNVQESKAKKYERALSLIQRGKFFDFSEDESHTSGNTKTNQDPLLGSYKTKNNMSHVDSCFTFCSINDLIKDTKKGKERSLSSSHHDNNFIGLCEDESIGESPGSNNNGNRHVTLEELGVSVEDLKSIPWEAFDPTWEIRSETMDPWLGGYVKGMPSSSAD